MSQKNKFYTYYKTMGAVTILMVIAVTYSYFRTSKSDRWIGWVPENMPPEPFEPRAIVNGQPPPNFEIAITEPDSFPVIEKPSESRIWSVCVEYPRKDSEVDPPTPTFVYIRFIKKNKFLYGELLKPSKLIETEQYIKFYYSSEIKAPPKIGEYRVIGEAQFSIFGTEKPKKIGDVTFPELFKKSTSEVELHVRN